MKKKNIYKPIYKSYIKLNKNVQSRSKFLSFKKQKWKKFILVQNELKNKKKISLFDHYLYLKPKYGFSFINKYKFYLYSKQRFKLFYGQLSDKNFNHIYKKVYNKFKINNCYNKSSFLFLSFLEKRLDVILYRTSFLNSLRSSRQLICHGKVYINGKKITISQLFTSEIEIEHIFPWSRSLNDSFNNKTLCFTNENRAKENRTPYEFYSSQGDEKWETIKLQALNCFKTKAKYPNCYTKFKHFVKKKHDEDFISRQLNDTRYISKEAKNYLSKICTKVLVAPGQMTATLRRYWGLNSILNKEDNTKTRNDHRHHAIDALVMACSTRSHLHELTKRNRYRKNHELKDFPDPWFNFRRDVEKAVEQILVSHKKTKNILTIRTRTTIKKGVKHRNTGVAARGQLHKESVYGKRKDVFTKELNYHIRKPLISLSAAEIPKIVDLEIKKIIYKAIEEIGLNIDDNRKPIVKTREDKKLFEQLLSKPFFLPNKNGNPVPIKKIRIQKKFSNAKPLKESKNQWVDLGKNHHVLIYKDFNGNFNQDVVTFWTAVNRKRKGKEVFQLPKDGKEMVTTLQKNELFLLGLKDDDIDWKNLNYNLLKKRLTFIYIVCHYVFTLIKGEQNERL